MAPSLYAYLNPKCKYSLHIGPSIVQSLVLSTLNLGTMFIGYLAVVILLCLKNQMNHMYQYEEFPSLVYVLQKFDNVYILLHVIRLLTERKFFLILGRVCFDPNKFTVEDALTMLTPILLHLYAYLTIHLIRFGLELIIKTLSELLYYLGLKNAVKNFTVAPQGAYQTEIFVVLLIAVSWNTCWGIYCIGASTYYLLKLTAFYNQLKDTSDLINAFGKQQEQCVHFKAKDVDSDGIPFALYPRVRFLFKSIQGAYHLHFTLFVMMFILTIISVPETISWAYNLWYSETVPLSDAVKILLVFSYIFTSVWSVNLMYRIKVDLYERLSAVLSFLTIIIITYSLVNIYRLNFIFHVVFFFIAGSNAHINTLRRANANPSKQS